MEAKVVKPFRWGPRVFNIGEIGKVVEVDKPLTYKDEPIYDFYVRFPNYPPIGVRKEEVELIPK